MSHVRLRFSANLTDAPQSPKEQAWGLRGTHVSDTPEHRECDSMNLIYSFDHTIRKREPHNDNNEDRAGMVSRSTYTRLDLTRAETAGV